MSIFEYNKEEEERKIRKAEYEAGETRILNLIQRLALDGRSDEIPKLATDRDLLIGCLKNTIYKHSFYAKQKDLKEN